MRKHSLSVAKASPTAATTPPLVSHTCAPISPCLTTAPDTLHGKPLSSISSADHCTAHPAATKPFEKMSKNTGSDGQTERFDGWLKTALSSGVKDFETFAMGLKREQSGVEAALTLPYSNGQTEDQINKLKLIKRQMYGRGSFQMLRQRILALLLISTQTPKPRSPAV